MTGQVYYSRKPNPDEGFIYLFDKEMLVAKIPIKSLTDKAADEGLKRMRLQRKGKWEMTSWGREAKIYFKLSKIK